MKLKVFDHEEPEKVVRLKIKESCNCITIYVVDAAGNPTPRSNIAEITPYGIYRCSGLSRALGFPLDQFDRIKLNEDEHDIS